MIIFFLNATDIWVYKQRVNIILNPRTLMITRSIHAYVCICECNRLEAVLGEEDFTTFS